jgi:hypothetical protein
MMGFLGSAEPFYFRRNGITHGNHTRRAPSMVREAGCREPNSRLRRREKNVLDISFYRSGHRSAQNPSMVGIELGCVCFRQRVSTLILSAVRWVHNSAMATFSEVPL